MTTLKTHTATMLGLASIIVGVWLRLKAHALAWPLEWSYGGPREDTIWAIHEQGYQDLSLVVLSFGLLVLIVVLIHWLWSPVADTKEKRQT